MISTDLSPFVNHLWQSTLFAVAVWLLTIMLRKNRAAVRYWLWLLGSAKFLVPFSLLVSLGGQLGWRSAPPTVRPQLAAAVTEARSLSEIDSAIGSKGAPEPKHFCLKMFWSRLCW
jgi:hypothetical protein